MFGGDPRSRRDAKIGALFGSSFFLTRRRERWKSLPSFWWAGALGFVLAVVSALLTGYELMGVDSEGFSRACNNLVLIGIALTLMSKKS